MSACPDKLLLVHALADNELDAANAVALEAHLATCAGCRAELARVQALRAVVRPDTLGDVMPAGAQARLLAALDADVPAEAAAVAAPRRSVLGDVAGWIFGWRWASGALTGLAAGAALVFFVLPPQPQSGPEVESQLVASHVRSLMADHLADIASSDGHSVKPWFNGRIDFAPPAPELAGQGFPLSGGRLDYVDKQTVAAVVYRRRQHVINLFVRPVRDARPAFAETDRTEGYNLQRWRAGGLEFYAVSDLNAKELNDFAAAYRKAAGL